MRKHFSDAREAARSMQNQTTVDLVVPSSSYAWIMKNHGFWSKIMDSVRLGRAGTVGLVHRSQEGGALDENILLRALDTNPMRDPQDRHRAALGRGVTWVQPPKKTRFWGTGHFVTPQNDPILTPLCPSRACVRRAFGLGPLLLHT